MKAANMSVSNRNWLFGAATLYRAMEYRSIFQHWKVLHYGLIYWWDCYTSNAFWPHFILHICTRSCSHMTDLQCWKYHSSTSSTLFMMCTPLNDCYTNLKDKHVFLVCMKKCAFLINHKDHQHVQKFIHCLIWETCNCHWHFLYCTAALCNSNSQFDWLWLATSCTGSLYHIILYISYTLFCIR